MRTVSFFLPVLLLCSFAMHAQDSLQKPRKLQVHGYVKALNIVSFVDNADELYNSSLLHSRTNLRWMPLKTIEVRAELRTRLFLGDQVYLDPLLPARLDEDNGWADLSWVIAEHRALIFHTTFDRASIAWKKNKWEVTAGRQRINWGISTAWNPNDIFNAFNYFDFDYEERPGTDAVRVQYYTGALSAVELAVHPAGRAEETVAGLLYRFNRKNYDLQFLAGKWKQDWMAGCGWAGGIGDWGFKGEASYFHPEKNFTDTTGAASVSLSLDRTFKGDNYFTFAFLYISDGSTHGINIASLPSMELSARRLMPFRYSFLVQGSHLFSPLLSGNLGAVYSPSGNSLVLLPSCAYSLSDNAAADLIGQLFFSTISNTYRAAGNSIFLRVRYDF